MDCEAYRILISGYIDGELSEQEMQMLKVHLQTCEACAGYLQKLESMQTALKRYTLFQDMPEIPSNFAGRVTEQLQDIIEEKQSSFGNTLRTRYRTWVIELAERWAGSLKTRPFAWTTLASCFLVLLTGVVCFELFQYSALNRTNQFITSAPESLTRIARNGTATAPPKTFAPMMAAAPQEKALQEEDNAIHVDDTTESTMPFEAEEGSLETDVSSQYALNASKAVSPEETEETMENIIEVADEPFILVAHNDEAEPVEDYVYSHVIEAYQGHFVDDVMFVGYVQDAFIE